MVDQASQGSGGAATRRRRADAERSIESILDAAVKGVLSDGELNISAVARDAGLSRVTLYAHFPTREALLEAVLRRAVSLAAAVIDDAEIERGTAPQALSRLLRSSWTVLSRHRNLHAVASTEMTPARLRDQHEPFVDPLTALVARGQADGDFRTDLPTSWLIATIFNVLHLAAEELDAGHLAAEETADVVTATVLSVLAHPGQRAGPHDRGNPIRGSG